MTQVPKTDQLGALGVTLVQHVVEEQLGWIFRRIEHRDTGLDAQTEVVLAEEATGLLLGLQIKTGKKKYFKEPTTNGWWYRGRFSHLRYWREYNLSVIIILVDEDSKIAYWTHVPENDDAIVFSDKSWKIEVPKNNVLSEGCLPKWMDYAWARSPRDALYRYCVLHRKYIEILEAGGQIFLKASKWVNKTRGQAEFTLILQDDDGSETSVSFAFFAGIHDVHEFATIVFPWADVDIDEDFYDIHEDVPPEAVFQDDDEPGGYFIVPGERESGIRPYSDGGEVASYRFRLELNEVGKSFAKLNAAGASMSRYPPYYVARVLSRDDEDE